MLNGGKPEEIFAERLAETICDAQDVLDVGTSPRFAKELRRYEQWFAGKRYVAASYEPSQTYGAYNCDCHQDIQAMSFADESFDAVLCIEVVEHVADPFAAARELRRVLRPGGTAAAQDPLPFSVSRKGERLPLTRARQLSGLLALDARRAGATLPRLSRRPRPSPRRAHRVSARSVSPCSLVQCAAAACSSRCGGLSAARQGHQSSSAHGN
jgi:SAM-dependent methyltransferase